MAMFLSWTSSTRKPLQYLLNIALIIFLHRPVCKSLEHLQGVFKIISLLKTPIASVLNVDVNRLITGRPARRSGYGRVRRKSTLKTLPHSCQTK